MFPFGSRLRETHAVFPGGDFDDPVAAITLLNNRVATAPVELASRFVHKDALIPLPYSCTNHGNHILSLEILKLRVTGLIPEKRWESIVHLATNQIRKCVLWPKTFSLSIKKLRKFWPNIITFSPVPSPYGSKYYSRQTATCLRPNTFLVFELCGSFRIGALKFVIRGPLVPIFRPM
jgi:hypothetical protein